MHAPAQLRPKRLLQSWKEIAGYLGVTVRTVQRWEKEAGLPIHRQGSGRKARVVAYSDELDSWMTRGKGLQKDAESHRWRYLLALGAFVMIAGTLIIGYLSWGVDPTRLVIEGNRLRAFGSRNQVCWEKTYPALGALAKPADQLAQLIDVDGDGRSEVLFNFVPANPAESRGKLVCYRPDGSQRWEFFLGREMSHAGREFNISYVAQFVRLVSSGNRRYILTVANHYLWFPSQVALIDPVNGKLIEEYWHPGGLFHLAIQDLDNDGIEEVLVSGINNPGLGLGHGVLAVLKIPFSAVSPAPDAVKSPFFDLTRGREYAYFLFPCMDVFAAQGNLPLVSQLAVTPDRRILVRVTGADVHAFYYLDFNLNLVDSRFSDNLVAIHNGLWRTGLLDHAISADEIAKLGRVVRFPTAPDGNSVEVESALRTWPHSRGVAKRATR